MRRGGVFAEIAFADPRCRAHVDFGCAFVRAFFERYNCKSSVKTMTGISALMIFQIGFHFRHDFPISAVGRKRRDNFFDRFFGGLQIGFVIACFQIFFTAVGRGFGDIVGIKRPTIKIRNNDETITILISIFFFSGKPIICPQINTDDTNFLNKKIYLRVHSAFICENLRLKFHFKSSES